MRSYQALDASTERARVIALLDCGHRQVVERVKGTKAKVRCWYCQELGAAAGALQ